MTQPPYIELDELELDALTELVNIGVSRGAGAGPVCFAGLPWPPEPLGPSTCAATTESQINRPSRMATS